MSDRSVVLCVSSFGLDLFLNADDCLGCFCFVRSNGFEHQGSVDGVDAYKHAIGQISGENLLSQLIEH